MIKIEGIACHLLKLPLEFQYRGTPVRTQYAVESLGDFKFYGPLGWMRALRGSDTEAWSALWDYFNPAALVKVPAHLRIAEYSPALGPFIEYLRTAAAKTELYFKVPVFRADEVKEQYFSLTAQPLVEGEGFSIYHEGANKRGAEGSVTFQPCGTLSALIQAWLPKSESGEITETGKINHIDFVWMLVKQGFRCTRLTNTACV